jgi:hypothetical protein
MEDDQRNARIFGVLFIITFLTSIPALALFQPFSTQPRTSPVAERTTRSTWESSSSGFSSSRTSQRPSSCSRSLDGRTKSLHSAMSLHGSSSAPSSGPASSLCSDREPAPGRSGRCRPRSLARSAQGLDVLAGPRLHRRLGEWTDTRLPDVQLQSRI